MARALTDLYKQPLQPLPRNPDARIEAPHQQGQDHVLHNNDDETATDRSTRRAADALCSTGGVETLVAVDDDDRYYENEDLDDREHQILRFEDRIEIEIVGDRKSAGE